MKSQNSIKFLEKWNKKYPFACKALVRHLEIINKDIGKEELPAEMIIEFHQAVAKDISDEVGAVSDLEEMVQVRFEDLAIQSEFFWEGKKHIKLNNEFMRVSVSNCKCLDTSQERRFKPNYMCMVKPSTQSLG